MSLAKPFRRTLRPFSDGRFGHLGQLQYIECKNYAISGKRYIRAALLIQDDLMELFKYVEPDIANFSTYSLRTNELLVRTCIEIEANLKAILVENGYEKEGNINIGDFKKLEKTHYLSEFTVKVPEWNDPDYVFRPFACWTDRDKPTWYRAYNASKHDRHLAFSEGNFGELTTAVCGLFAVLASQFHVSDLSPRPSLLSIGGGLQDGFLEVAGGYFRVKFPENYPVEERYSFLAEDIEDTDAFFEMLFK